MMNETRLLTALYEELTPSERGQAIQTARAAGAQDAHTDFANGGGDDPAGPNAYYLQQVEHYADTPREEFRANDPRVQAYVAAWSEAKAEIVANA